MPSRYAFGKPLVWPSLSPRTQLKPGVVSLGNGLGIMPKGGAGALHKFTKPRVPWKADGAVSFAGVAPSVATLQDVVNAQAKGWEALWDTRKGSSAPDLSNHLDNEPPLRRLSATQIRAAAGSFKAATGLGGDNVHPRWFAHLSDKSLDRIAFFLHGRIGACPVAAR